MKKGTVWVLGASSGLGLATAQAFAASGWLVIGGARSFECRDLDREDKLGFICLPLDVTNEESCDRFVRQAFEWSEQVDILVSCAAMLMLGSCEMTSTDEYTRIMETNFIGTVRMVQMVLPHMRKKRNGKIILFSSINGLLGIPFQSAYTASKHAIEGFAECLAMEVKPFGIGVCVVEPGDHSGGSTHTRLHANAESDTSPYSAAYQAATKVIGKDEAKGLSPDKLGAKVVRNAERRHMRFRLRVAKLDQHAAVWMHDVLLPSINAMILRQYYGAK
ncbi:MAG: SDR family oxidoreductase [Clostridiales bacterium]|nr:SDR family oxidoreductase [Clostridiales bacterium]